VALRLVFYKLEFRVNLDLDLAVRPWLRGGGTDHLSRVQSLLEMALMPSSDGTVGSGA
jgi:hypothetical protein